MTGARSAHAGAAALAGAAVALAGAASAYDLTPDAPRQGRLFCRHFPTYQDAVAFCRERYGTTVGCGGLDRDRDGRPCECNRGGPETDSNACRSRRARTK